MRKLSLILVGVLCLSSFASAAEVTVLGGITNGKFDSGGNSSKGTGLTFGAALNGGDLGLGPEIGLFSVGQKESSVGSEVSGRAWEVPLLLRFSLPIVSAAGGAYYQKYSTKKFGASQKDSDFGLKLNGRIRLPLAPLTRFVIDASYKKGLANIAAVSGSWKNTEIDLLAGLSFGF